MNFKEFAGNLVRGVCGSFPLIVGLLPSQCSCRWTSEKVGVWNGRTDTAIRIGSLQKLTKCKLVEYPLSAVPSEKNSKFCGKVGQVTVFS